MPAAPVRRTLTPRTALTPALPDVRVLTLAHMHESPTNPRRIFKDLEGLAADLRALGQLAPLIVRPSPSRSGLFEIVVGARRYRAAKLGRIARLIVFVRELDDALVLKLQTAENNQRDDVHPVEEADAFRRLHAQYGESIATIAAFVGRSEAYVYERLRLCALIPAAQQAYLDARIRPRPALWIARIPAPLQPHALADVLALIRDGELPDDATVRKHLLATYTLRLDLAPWALDDDALDKAAGPCTSCSKRTGNQGELFNDISHKDTCTDPPCFKAKGDKHWQRLAQEARKQGLAVLDPDDANRLYPAGSALAKDAPYLDLDAPAPEDGKGRSYRELLGSKLPRLTLVRDPWTGAAHTLLRKADLSEALERAGHTRVAQRLDEPPPEGEEPLTRKERQAHRQAADTALDLLEQRARSKPAGVAYYRLVLAGLIQGADDATVIELARRRGWFERTDEAGKVEKLRPTKGNALDQLERLSEEMGEQELRGLTFALAVAQNAHDRDREAPVFARACRAYEVGFPALLLASRAAAGLVDVQPGELPVEVPAPPKRCRCCHAGEQHQAVFVEPDLCRTCRAIGVAVETCIANETAPSRTQDDVIEHVAKEGGWKVTSTTSVFLDRVRMGRIYADAGNKGQVRTVRMPERAKKMRKPAVA